MNEGKFSIGEAAGRGQGLFSDRPFEKGETVFQVMFGASVQPFHFVNHSCAPSCRMHYHWVIAGRDLQPGDEITIDYNTIQFACAPLAFDCRCGAQNCRGRIELPRQPYDQYSHA